MKKILTLSIVTAGLMAVFASCEKDKKHSYVCTCTVNQHLTGNTSGNPARTFVVDGASTNNVQATCEMQMNAVLNNSGQSFTCTYE